MAGLGQGQTWTTADGTELRIADMEPRHARNAYAYLMRRASRIQMRYAFVLLLSLPEHMGEHAEEEVLRDLDRAADGPEAWLAEFPLLVALRERGNADYQALEDRW